LFPFLELLIKKMVLGQHGRRFLYPLTATQRVVSFPWKKLYNQSLYFRMVARVSVFTAAAWAYADIKGFSN
jgi:hypothetical protein